MAPYPWKHLDTIVVLTAVLIAIVGSISLLRLEVATHPYETCLQAHQNTPVAADQLCAPLIDH